MNIYIKKFLANGVLVKNKKVRQLCNFYVYKKETNNAKHIINVWQIIKSIILTYFYYPQLEYS